MAKRTEDVSTEGYLELQKTKAGISISVHKDPESDEIGNSIQFNQGGKSPATYNAILELFKIGEETRESIRNIELGTSNDVLELLLNSDGSLIISTKPETIEIKPNEISKKTKKTLKKLQKSMASDIILYPQKHILQKNF